MFAEVTVPTSVSEVMSTARQASELPAFAMLIISQTLLLVGGLWLIRKQNERLEAKEKSTEEMTRQMIQVVANNNSALEDFKELCEKMKSKGSPILMALFACAFAGCSTSNITGSKHWKWQPPVSVVQAERQYAVGTNGQAVLIKEISYFIQPGTNTPVEYVVKNRAKTLADAKNNLTKAKSLLSEKTISAGVDALEQESKGDVVPNSIEKIGTAVPNIIKGANGIP